MKNKNPVLYNLFSSFGVFSSAEIEQILSQFEPKTYQQGAVILAVGELMINSILSNRVFLASFRCKTKPSPTG